VGVNTVREDLPTDLLALVAWAALAVAVVSLPVVRETPLRIAVAGPFLLFAPGYALVSVLFPRDEGLSTLARIPFGVGASLALVGLSGVPLDATPWGIRWLTVIATQAGLVWVLVGVAWYRRRQVAPEERAVPLSSIRAAAREHHWTAEIGGGSRVLQVAIVVAVLASVGTAAYAVTTPLPSERFTELSVTGPDGSVDSIPSSAAPGETVSFQMGIANHEHRTVEYGIQIQVVDPGGGSSVVRTEDVTLGHGGSFDDSVAVQVPAEAGEYRIDVLVFRDGAPGSVVEPGEAYRDARIWISVD